MSCSCVNVILSLRRIRHSDGRNEKLDRSFVACPARSEPASGAHGPALREASLRAEPTGLPCAKRACERSPRACPARSEPASGAHGFLLRMAMCSALQLDGERVLPGVHAFGTQEDLLGGGQLVVELQAQVEPLATANGEVDTIGEVEGVEVDVQLVAAVDHVHPVIALELDRVHVLEGAPGA